MSDPADKNPEVLVLSCVGGGVVERLARSITKAGTEARLVSGSTESTWRRSFSNGPVSRLAARLSAFVWYPIFAFIAVARSGARAIITTTNPFHLPFLLVATRPLHRKPVIALVYDLYPDALEATGRNLPGTVASLLAAGNRFVFRRADHVVFIGDRIGAHARARYGVPTKWKTIATGGDFAEFESVAETRLTDELEQWRGDRILVTYIGNLGSMHEWRTLHGIAHRLDASDEVAIVFAASGSNAERLREACLGVSPELVRFEPPLEVDDWRGVMALSDVALVTLRASAALTSVPSKAYSALAAGAALLAILPADSDVGKLVDANACGLRVDPDDVDTAMATLHSWATDRDAFNEVRRSARTTATSTDLPALAADWVDVLDQVNAAKTASC